MHSCITPGGFWHIATDWAHYAQSISELFAQPNNQMQWDGGKVSRPDRALTRYEARAIEEGRIVSDFRYIKKKN
jgi:tRNA (guanine-N7-)-methyltransferase